MSAEITIEGLKTIVKDAMRAEKQAIEANQESHVEHVCRCSNCYQDIIKKMVETSEVACENCGLPLGTLEFAQKIDKCPSCTHTSLREISEDDKERWRRKMSGEW